MPTPPSTPGGLRRDARRNLELVLVAAERVFAARGLGATLEEVASAAGVGVATIYRRFPSKEALVQAVFDQKIQSGVDLVSECLQAASAWEGLGSLLRTSLDRGVSDRGLLEFMYTPTLISDRLSEVRLRVAPLATALIDRAKAEGALREDFQYYDLQVIVLTLGRLAHTHPTLGPTLSRRYLELLLKGLSPGHDAAEIPPPLDQDSYASWVASLTP